MIKAHRSVVVWRLVGPSSGAKTCPHVFSRHSSLSKHSHRVGDWLTNSSHHAKLIIYHFTPSVDCLAHVFDTLRQDLREDMVSFLLLNPLCYHYYTVCYNIFLNWIIIPFDINVDKNQETVQFTLENTKHQHYYIAPIPSSPSQSIGHDHLLSITIPFSFP